MRLTLLAAACLLSAPIVAHAQATDAARRLAQDAIIVDTHIDAPGVLTDKWADLAGEHKDREFDYPKARAGGLEVAPADAAPAGTIVARYPSRPTRIGALVEGAGLARYVPAPIARRLLSPSPAMVLVRRPHG